MNAARLRNIPFECVIVRIFHGIYMRMAVLYLRLMQSVI